MILSHVWGYSFDPAHERGGRARVTACATKIDRDFEPKLLHTVRGAGYVLKAG